jgi:tetratricopeptide (TPR) repeat protein
LEDSTRFFKQAAEEDPDYALAHVGLAEAYCVLGSYGFLPPKIAFAKAKAAVERASSLDDHLAEAHRVLGLIHFWWDWDWDGAEQRFLQSLDLEPTSSETHSLYALLMSCLGRREEAMAMSIRALELDPLSPHARALSGGVHLFAGAPEKALKEYKKALECDPDSIDALFGLAICYSSGSAHDKAIAQYEKILASRQNASFFLGMLGTAYGLAGRREEAQAVVNELTDRLRREYVPPFALANVWAGMNEPDHAFKWLKKAHQDRVGFLWIVKTMRQWDPLRSDPRFEDFLHRMNLGK